MLQRKRNDVPALLSPQHGDGPISAPCRWRLYDCLGGQLDRRQDRLRLKRLALSQIAAAGRSQSRPSSVTGEMTAPSVQQVADEPESGICPAGTPRSAVGEHPEGEVPPVALANSKGEPQPRYAVQQVHGIQIADPHRA